MLFSEYRRAAKAMIMIEAREGLDQINYSNFADFDQKARESIQRRLKQSSDQYISRKLLDYKDVVANLARKLGYGRRQ
jgi:hypothetical protein